MPSLRTDGAGISTIRVLSLMRCGIGDVGKRNSLLKEAKKEIPHRLNHEKVVTCGIGEFFAEKTTEAFLDDGT